MVPLDPQQQQGLIILLPSVPLRRTENRRLDFLERAGRRKLAYGAGEAVGTELFVAGVEDSSAHP
jgi:hypothetical protein